MRQQRCQIGGGSVSWVNSSCRKRRLFWIARERRHARTIVGQKAEFDPDSKAFLDLSQPNPPSRERIRDSWTGCKARADDANRGKTQSRGQRKEHHIKSDFGQARPGKRHK